MVDPLLNVYSEERALHDFYNPDKAPLIPLVELPARLNPYRSDGVRIYAKLMSHVPATNVKSLPALNMIMRGQQRGAITNDTHTIVEYSSGSTVISLGILSNIYGIPHTKAYLSNKTSSTKLELLRFFPEPLDPNGGIFAAKEDGQQEGYYNPDQYANPENYEAHMRWTGPQIIKQLPGISVFAASIGTSCCSAGTEWLGAGTMTGCGLYLKEAKPSIARVGVCTAPGERVPGPRMFSLLAPVEFPWREAVDGIEEVGQFEAYEKSLALCRAGLLVGPSSGLALLGLFKFLDKKKAAGELDTLRNEEGENSMYYISEYFEKLGPGLFPPDQEFGAHGAPASALPVSTIPPPPPPSEIIVLDFRDAADFNISHIACALNLDVAAKANKNPFKDPPTMVRMFKVLEARLGLDDPHFGVPSEGKTVLTLSYKGHVARLAMSILRNRGIRAHCVMGGSEEWQVSEENGALWERSCQLVGGGVACRLIIDTPCRVREV
ncbi:tryptophan synthase beta subunit-like PLP-dependent enzyme [Mycena rebaudengoi]|nr:tryptophan synthase beta subunit-like PLP-dependent enzyme [Mycena rebaudengoi]